MQIKPIVIYNDEFLEHPGGTSPERPSRLKEVVSYLRCSQSIAPEASLPWAEQIAWRLPSTLIERDPLPEIYRVHQSSYVQSVKDLALSGGGQLGQDVEISSRSYHVALLAVNAWLDGVDLAESLVPSFVLARPPGHHALRDRAMGYCIFANAAIAAHYALLLPGIERVGILDWDVHHGNGTQALVQHNPQIGYCSLHQAPCYPGTGSESEIGSYFNVLNLPVAPGANGADYKELFEERVLPFFEFFKPDLLIVSAGYDANAADPIAKVCLQPSDFGVFTRYCFSLTPKVVFGLEGGYESSSLGQSIGATLEQFPNFPKNVCRKK